jgi:hypothetical protein
VPPRARPTDTPRGATACDCSGVATVTKTEELKGRHEVCIGGQERGATAGRPANPKARHASWVPWRVCRGRCNSDECMICSDGNVKATDCARRNVGRRLELTLYNPPSGSVCRHHAPRSEECLHLQLPWHSLRLAASASAMRLAVRRA